VTHASWQGGLRETNQAVPPAIRAAPKPGVSPPGAGLAEQGVSPWATMLLRDFFNTGKH